jgi:hypothetical protein
MKLLERDQISGKEKNGLLSCTEERGRKAGEKLRR